MKKLFLIGSVLLSMNSFAFEEALTFSELGVDSIFNSSPVDDPIAYQVENGEYEVKASPFFWVVPGPGSASEDVISQKANNNVAIEFFDNRLFLAFRTAPSSNASKKARMYVISTADGVSWDLEWKSDGGRNIGEPQLVAYKSRLHFYYLTSRPDKVHKITRSGLMNWSLPQDILDDGEAHWEMKVRNGQIWMTSYAGSHDRLRGGAARLNLRIKRSNDGLTFIPESLARETVHLGGASETGFEFDDEGNLYAVTNNEDGDETGFGSHLVFAPSNLLSYWSMLSQVDAFNSPRMFRHGKEIYLIARKQKGAAPFGWAKRHGYAWRRILNWMRWALTPKTTALYRMNQDKRGLEHVMDLPGAGDTAYPSIRRVDANTFLFANYTSPLHRKNRKWFVGKLGYTKIYLQALKFVKK